jgi:putative peptide zinc metalloprotease protein
MLARIFRKDAQSRRALMMLLVTAAFLFVVSISQRGTPGGALAQTSTNTPTPSSAPPLTATATAPAPTPTMAPADTSTPAAAGTVVSTAGTATTATTPAPAGTPQPATVTATVAATPAPAATAAAASTADEQPAALSSEVVPGGGGHNNVNAVNRVDNRLLVRGSVELEHVPGPSAAPVNQAQAFASCNGCQTFAIALQIALISKTASSITPQNYAVAVNYQCNGCVTVARAIQYVLQVDDPTQTPDDVRNLVDQMQDQLQALTHDNSIAQADQAEAVINNVIAQFTELGQSLNDQRQEETQPTTPGASSNFP